LVALLVALALAVLPLRASADTTADKKRATALLQEGAKLLDRKEFAAALEKFNDAYRLVASAKIQFNIGLAQEGLDRPAEAIRAYRIYIDEATSDLAARRTDARVRIDALRPHVTHLQITSDAAGAQVLVDGVDEGRTPLARPVVVNPGAHQVVVQPPGGGAAWTRAIRGEPGAKIDLQVSAPALTPPPPPLLVNKVPEPRQSDPQPVVIDTPITSQPASDEPTPVYKRVWFWGVVGAVVAAGVVGAVLLTRDKGTTFVCTVEPCLTPGGK
jgi:hypothetical protein